MVTLKEFVSNSLFQIFEGVVEAQHKLKDSKMTDCYINHDGRNDQEVVFDISVTTSSSEQDKTGAGIFVGGFGVGGQVTGESANSIYSKIRFTVPIKLPWDVAER